MAQITITFPDGNSQSFVSTFKAAVLAFARDNYAKTKQETVKGQKKTKVKSLETKMKKDFKDIVKEAGTISA